MIDYFVNCDAVYGRGWKPSENPELSDLRARMDALGVARTVVHPEEADIVNPTIGNRKLLADIAASGDSGRWIPALTITPFTIYEEGAMTLVRDALANGAARGVRFSPDTGNFSILDLERVLGLLAEFKPLVIWDADKANRARGDFRELSELARRFSDLSFACVNLHGQTPAACDLLWRNPNVVLALSCNHRGYIETLAGDFGASRLLFSLGPKAYYGAAVANVVWAGLPEGDKTAIAAGNIERLLGLKPLRDVPYFDKAARADKPLWETFRRGRKLDDVTLIDAHGHLGASHRGWLKTEIDYEKQARSVSREMDALGVSEFILSSEPALFGEPIQANRETREAVERTTGTGRIKGYYAYNPFYHESLREAVNEVADSDFFIGFKILPGYWRVPVTDPRYQIIYELADRYRLPILTHSWSAGYDSPALFRDIAKKYPGATFFIGHSGGGDVGRREAEALALECPNVFLEFCGSFTSEILWEETIAKVGPERVVYGSDAVSHAMAWELGRFLSISLPDATLRPILGENAGNVLKKRRKT